MAPPQAGSVMDKQQIELIGVAALTAALIREGFEIARPLRDRGVDLVLFSDDSARCSAILIQVKTHSETGLEVFRERYAKFPGLVYAMVWQALSQPRYFLFDYAEAVALIPETSRQQRAWTAPQGHWTWTHPRVPPDVQQKVAGFENRWEWLRARLLHANSSGAQI
jgi:hypothetical protein